MVKTLITLKNKSLTNIFWLILKKIFSFTCDDYDDWVKEKRARTIEKDESGNFLICVVCFSWGHIPMKFYKILLKRSYWNTTKDECSFFLIKKRFIVYGKKISILFHPSTLQEFWYNCAQNRPKLLVKIFHGKK